MKNIHLAGKLFITAAPLVLSLLNACANGPKDRTYTPSSENQNSNHASPSSPSSLIQETQQAYQKGNYAYIIEATAPGNEGKVESNELAEFYNIRGLSYLAQKQPIKAESNFRKAISSNETPSYAGYFQYNLAVALTDSHQLNEASKTISSISMKDLDASHLKKVAQLKEKIEWNNANASSARASTQTEAAAAAKTATTVNAKESTPSNASASTQTVTPPSASVSGPVIKTYAGPVFDGPVEKQKIGLLLPLSGKYENFGNRVKRAVDLAIQNHNAAAGNSKDSAKLVELITVDSGESGASHAEALKKLVEQEKVIAVIGPLLSRGVDTLAEKAAYYQVPLISIAPSQGPVSPELFSCSLSNRDQASKMVDYAMKNRGMSKFAILAPSNQSGEEMAQAFWDEIQSRNGEVKAFELYDPNDTDFKKPVDRALGLFYTDARAKEIKELADQRKELNITKKTMKTAQYFELPPLVDFDAVFIADEAKTAGQVIPTFAYRGVNKMTYFGISTWNSPQLTARVGDYLEGAAFPVGFNTLNPSTETQEFIDQYRTAYSSVPNELDAIAYDATEVIFKVQKESPNTRSEFKAKLETLGTIQGATGIFTIQNHRCTRTLATYGVEKGKIVTVDEKQMIPYEKPTQTPLMPKATPTPEPTED